jgi:hypothetical protein
MRANGPTVNSQGRSAAQPLETHRKKNMKSPNGAALHFHIARV